MSESVNFKVVITFIIFIFIFAGIGLFGLFNKDLIQTKEETTTKFVPVVNSENSMACSGDVLRGSLKYEFILTPENSIKSLRITYTAKEGTTEDFADATTLNTMNVVGVNTTIQNEYNNFVLMIYINRNNVDINALLEYKPFFDKLGIIVDTTTSYGEYNTLLGTLNNLTCENTSK